MKNLILVLLISCGTVKNVQEQNASITGKWCLTANQINYPKIIFGADSFVTLDSKMDTVYSHKYYLQGDRIRFVLIDSKISESKILKLTKDSLILSNLLEHQTPQVYYRCDK